jgi:hypothetical protein
VACLRVRPVRKGLQSLPLLIHLTTHSARPVIKKPLGVPELALLLHKHPLQTLMFLLCLRTQSISNAT